MSSDYVRTRIDSGSCRGCLQYVKWLELMNIEVLNRPRKTHLIDE